MNGPQPQSPWPGFRLPFGRRPEPFPLPAPPPAPPPAEEEVMDTHSQVEELIGHVRRCERWAQLDDKIDLSLGIRR